MIIKPFYSNSWIFEWFTISLHHYSLLIMVDWISHEQQIIWLPELRLRQVWMHEWSKISPIEIKLYWRKLQETRIPATFNFNWHKWKLQTRIHAMLITIAVMKCSIGVILIVNDFFPFKLDLKFPALYDEPPGFNEFLVNVVCVWWRRNLQLLQ